MARLLYILRGMVPPRYDGERDVFTYLSEIAEGDVLLPVWWRSPEQADPHLRSSFPKYRVGNFCYHQFLDLRYPRGLRRLARFLFYLRRGLQLHRQKQFDVITSYGTNLTGIAGVLLKWLTGAKLIVELPNVPENAYRYYDIDEGTIAALKRFLANLALYFVCLNSDCINALYPWQLQKYPLLKKKRTAVFPCFVPLHTIAEVPTDEKFILLAGFPWYTKGADLLIQAFKPIAPQFPDWKLKLMGHYPDRTYLDKLAEGCAQIEILKARPNAEALRIIGACSLFVLASRTDAAPVVVREAMAARKPVLGSDVGGVAYFVRDKDTGLLFQAGNIADLSDKLSTLLRDPELRNRLARRGHEMIMATFDERAFVRFTDEMLRSTLAVPQQNSRTMLSSREEALSRQKQSTSASGG
jgi:glycosyltransferase involved in cell wall biosynthesis